MPDSLVIVRVTLALTALILFLVTFHMIRKERLREAYSILWLATASAIMVFAIWPRVIFLIQIKTGITYFSLMLGVTLVLLLLIVFHFSLVISRLDKENKRTAQRVAFLADKLEQFESKKPATKNNSNSYQKETGKT